MVFFSGHKYTSDGLNLYTYIYSSVLLVVLVQQHRPSTGTLVLPKVHIVKTDPFTATGNTVFPTLKTLVQDTYMCEVNLYGFNHFNVKYVWYLFIYLL